MTVSALNSDTARAERFSSTCAQAATMPPEAQVRNAASSPAACSRCISNERCLGSRLTGNQSTTFVIHDYTLGNREHLFRQGDKPEALYIIKSGSAKLYFISEDGNEQVMAFYMPGEVLGLDALGSGMHRTSAAVLERTTFCVIPITSLEKASGYHHCLYKLLSMELVRDQGILGLIIKKDAEAKMAKFLLSLSQRFHARGYSASCFNLSMKRSEIGNHLGIAVETVSRILTRFQELGVLQVERRYIQIRNFKELEKLAECQSSHQKALRYQHTG
jgi:CRP/FNR family transcriptional regulator